MLGNGGELAGEARSGIGRGSTKAYLKPGKFDSDDFWTLTLEMSPSVYQTLGLQGSKSGGRRVARTVIGLPARRARQEHVSCHTECFNQLEPAI